jgi:hypothetical protein
MGAAGGEAAVTTVALADLLATKIRTLHQWRKGRDRFELHGAFERFPELDLKHTAKRGMGQGLSCLGWSRSWLENSQYSPSGGFGRKSVYL